jgi:hypothetical protein
MIVKAIIFHVRDGCNHQSQGKPVMKKTMRRQVKGHYQEEKTVGMTAMPVKAMMVKAMMRNPRRRTAMTAKLMSFSVKAMTRKAVLDT